MMRGGLLALVVAVAGGAGCLNDSLVPCGELLCPTGFSCDQVLQICVDPNGLAVPDGPIAFDGLGCGLSSELVVPIKNVSSAPISFATLPSIAGVVVTPSSGMLDPGASLDLSVVATAPTISTPGFTTSGTLVFQTDSAFLGRPLTVTTAGVTIDAAQSVEFGELAVGATGHGSVTLTNTGNVATDVVLTNPSTPFAVTNVSGPVNLVPDVPTSIAVGFDAGVLGDFTSQLSLSFSGALCQASPPPIALHGISSGAPILSDHQTLDFGTSGCGAAALALPVTLTNNLGSAQPLNISLTGTDTALFTAPASDSIPAGPAGLRAISVTRNAIPTTTTVGAKSATLTIDAPNASTTKIVNLVQSIRAPVMSVDVDTLDFGTVPKNALRNLGVIVTNSGNAVANVTITPTSAPHITVSPNAFQLQPGFSTMVTFTLTAGPVNTSFAAGFTLNVAGACSPLITIVVSGNVCANPPCPL